MDTIKLVIIAVIITLITSFGYMGYKKVKDIGFQEATLICEQNFKKYEQERDAKIAQIELDSRNLVTENQKKADKLTKKMSDTIKQLKNQPLVLVKENKCVLTETFSDSFGKINQTANQNMKDTSK